MKYQLNKLVNGNLYLNDDIVLTKDTPCIVLDETDVKAIPAFDTYKKDNPFCKVAVLKSDDVKQDNKKLIK